MNNKAKSENNGRKGTTVDVIETRGKYFEVILGDGTILQVRLIGTEAIRLDEWDNQDRPVYALTSQNVVTIKKVPDELMKKE